MGIEYQREGTLVDELQPECVGVERLGASPGETKAMTSTVARVVSDNGAKRSLACHALGGVIGRRTSRQDT